MKIIGAGFGRTGTVSLQQAFDHLGYPCYHMQEVMKAYRRGHVQQWAAALDGEDVDWDALFAGYEACVDFPACMFYHQLMEAFPDAVVILSVRDPEAWWRSYSKLLGLVTKASLFNFVPLFREFSAMNTKLVGKVFGAAMDKDACIARYLQHIEEVKATVPQDRLLVYSVTEGWEPLCRFLGHPVPDIPFPHANAGIRELRASIVEQFWQQGIRKLFSRDTTRGVKH
ncbi:MAG: hypothetical protein JSV45_10070 [Chromatiales bacterium]|nr:MAG: hypothetical protein JSV45_10070 [Chromatiales bacterium]